jgi:UDP-N-acetylglucosamine 2-epimerase (non-hydrolysing)
VNSTLACAIVAKKECIPVAHGEAGLLSGDMAMPEEVNRIVTDSITDFFFATEPAALANLLREGKPRERIFHVGHVMVDNLVYQRDQLAGQPAAAFPTAALKAEYPRYGVVTLHRPSNVDDSAALRRIAIALRDVSQRLPLVFPVHPRTRVNLQKFGIELGPRVVRTPPLSYMEFLNLWKDAVVVLTDSGGLQEETTALGVPCITLRENTERPVTVTEGTNVLAGTDPARIEQAVAKVLRGDIKAGRRPALWDGRAAERIVQILQKALVSRSRARIAA